MKIEILKDHESGLKKGQIKDVRPSAASQLIKSGLAKEVKEKAEKAPKKDKAEKAAPKNKAKK
jgi:ribosomal protein L9